MRSIPRSYAEINYKTYVAIMNKIPSEKPDGIDAAEWSYIINMATLSILMDCTEAEIGAMRATEIKRLMQIIAFMDEPPKRRKTTFKIKSMEELTYDEFSQYQRLRLDQWNNLQDILLIFLKGSTPEQVDQMNIDEVMQVFFCLNKKTKRSLTRLKYSTLLRAIRQTIARIFPRFPLSRRSASL